MDQLSGDPSKARDKLGCTPCTSFDELVREMVREDLPQAKRDATVQNAGYRST